MRLIRLRLSSLAIIIGAILAAACEPIQDQPGPGQVPTTTPIPTAPAVARPTYVVQRGDVVNPLEFTGRWQPRDQMQLSFEVDGTVRRVEVQRGDTVTAGQLLADLNIEQLEEQLEDAELQLETALEGAESDTEGAVEQVTSAEEAVFNATLALQRHLDTSPQGSIRSALRAWEDAQRNLEDARDNYYVALAENGQGGAGTVDGALEQLENAERALEDAEFSYREAAASAGSSITQWEQTRNDLENNLILAEDRLEEARSGAGSSSSDSIITTQRTIDRLKEDIARSTLISPIDGVVTEVTIQPADNVQAFDAVITVALPQPNEIIANLALGDAQRLSIGQVGVCYVDNQPDTAVQCAVRQIPLSARDPDQTTRVAASLEEVAQSGQIIRVEMPLEVAENVLWLPEVAIRTFQNRTFVVLDTPDGGRSVDVEIGLRTAERVEIISGLEEGDVVQGQ